MSHAFKRYTPNSIEYLIENMNMSYQVIQTLFMLELIFQIY